MTDSTTNSTMEVQSAQSYLKQARLYSDDVPYLMVQFPAQAITLAAGILAEVADPFSALIVDKDEITLIIPSEVQEDFAKRLSHGKPSAEYRLITLDIELPPTLIGFMAYVANALAAAKIPIIPLGAFSRDHLLVPAGQFEQAWQTLKELQEA